MIVLYHQESNGAIYCPSGTGKVEGPFIPLPPEKTPIRNYLLLRDPVERLKSLYWTSKSVVPFKIWFKSTLIESQLSILPNPDETLRAEYFERDIRNELGVKAALLLDSPKNVEICLATMTNINRIYYEDMLLGDYL